MFFLIKPDSLDGHALDATLFDWMETGDMEMQLIELKSSTVWLTKFWELRKQLEAKPVQDHRAHILTCWATAPEKFSCLRDIALALLSVLGSTYLCEQVFSHMKHVLSPTHSRLTTEHSEACLQLKVTNYELSQAKQGQGSHWLSSRHLTIWCCLSLHLVLVWMCSRLFMSLKCWCGYFVKNTDKLLFIIIIIIIIIINIIKLEQMQALRQGTVVSVYSSIGYISI